MADLLNLKKLLLPEIDVLLQRRLRPIEKKIDNLTSSMDGVAGILERHDQELLVLGEQQQKTTQVLVRKGIATPDELAVG